MRIVALLAVLVLALAAGCGGGDDGNGNGDGAPTNGAAASGEQVFTDNCASCHALEAAGSSGGVGPDLDELRPARDRVEQQVRQGGGGMPAFEGELTDEEITAVAQYVAESAGG